jgi:hypothetical protein
MTDDVAAPGVRHPEFGLVLSSQPAHTPMRHTVSLVDAAPTKSAVARLFGATPLTATARSSYREAIGELAVAQSLASLGDEWRVLHSVPVGDDGSVLDHLAIGPGGVFLVDTTVAAGADVVADQRSFVAGEVRLPAIRAMEFEMGRVERLLGTAAGTPVEVAGVLVVVDAKSVTVREGHRDVAVVRQAELRSWFSTRPAVLPHARVAQIAALAARVETWNASAVTCAEGDVVREQFSSLQRRVDAAWRLQRAWITAASIAAAGAFVIVTYAILVGALNGR